MSDFYKYENQERHHGKGTGWMIATMVLVAFLAGALIMKYLPGGASGAVLGETATPEAARTAKLTATATAEPTPAATLPQIGGENNLLLLDNIDIPAIVKADAPAVVGVLNKVKGRGLTAEATMGSGSGVIISADGYIVTNNHVVEGASSVYVVLSDGSEIKAEIVGADAQSDLAVLKIDKTGLAAIPLGDSDKLQVGDPVVAIGNPLGDDELAGTVTHGIISGKNRKISIDGYTYTVLQTDAAINPGNSGGALVNAKGELVGINNAKDSGAEGIGFAIPINVAKPVIEQLIRDGGIPRPMMGITPFDISEDQADFYNVPVGVAISALMENGPAAKAGLREGDIITEFDGQKVKTLMELRDVMNKHAVGDTVKVKVYRDQTREDLTVDLTLGSSMDLK